MKDVKGKTDTNTNDKNKRNTHMLKTTIYQAESSFLIVRRDTLPNNKATAASILMLIDNNETIICALNQL